MCIDNVTIAGVMDYSNDVFKDTESLNIPEDLNEVMTDVTLNQSGENGTVISWHSSNPSVISDDGKVTRPSVGQPDTEVTLTAYIMKGTYIETKTFKANVMRLLDDSESTKKDAEKLESYKNMILDVDISLPMEGANSTSIEWRSSNPSVLSNDGRINPNDTDERVIMTAIITRGDKSSSTEIPFYVLKKSTKNLMKDGKFSISSQETKNPITNINDGDLKTSWRASAADTNPVFEIDLGKKLDFTDLLIINGDSSINGIKISISDDASVWKSAGGFEATAESKINRFNFAEPNNSGRYMRIETDGTGQPEIYELRLCNNPSDDKRVETDLNSLELEPSKTAQGSFDLPLVLENGSSVKWTSSNENIIKIDLNGKATVTPGQSTQIVTLTAEISYGKVTKQKTFGITVSGTGGGSSGGGSSSGGSGSSGGGIPWNGTSDSANNSNNSGNFSEFEDLESVPWVIEAVMTLKNKGIVNGVNDKEFAPNESITREEFAAMAVRAFNLPTVDLNDELFVDVPQNMWYNTVVAAAYNAGIIKGRDDGSFGAGEKITREDMVVMLYRAAKLSGYKSIEFKDGDSVSDYAAEAVRELSAAGIITGDESGFFRPKATATRAEAAVMIYRIINR